MIALPGAWGKSQGKNQSSRNPTVDSEWKVRNHRRKKRQSCDRVSIVSSRAVRWEKLPVKEDRKWSLETNNNWLGGRRTLDKGVQACVQNFGASREKKCSTSVMRDTRTRGRKLKLFRLSLLALSLRPWQIYYRRTLASHASKGNNLSAPLTIHCRLACFIKKSAERT